MRKAFLYYIIFVCLAFCPVVVNAEPCPANAAMKSLPALLAEYNASATTYGCPAGYKHMYNIDESYSGAAAVTLGACVWSNAGPCWLFIPEGETGSDPSGEFVIDSGFCPYK
ncbi:MAG: hypothetical protein K2I81_03070 [Alphaproteobacteria bacterium]|nr:hypothetical protein [Alphaproteobacteria bacterium]